MNIPKMGAGYRHQPQCNCPECNAQNAAPNMGQYQNQFNPYMGGYAQPDSFNPYMNQMQFNPYATPMPQMQPMYGGQPMYGYAPQPNMYPNQQMMYNQPPMYGYMNQPQMQPQLNMYPNWGIQQQAPMYGGQPMYGYAPQPNMYAQPAPPQQQEYITYPKNMPNQPQYGPVQPPQQAAPTIQQTQKANDSGYVPNMRNYPHNVQTVPLPSKNVEPEKAADSEFNKEEELKKILKEITDEINEALYNNNFNPQPAQNQQPQMQPQPAQAPKQTPQQQTQYKHDPNYWFAQPNPQPAQNQQPTQPQKEKKPLFSGLIELGRREAEQAARAQQASMYTNWNPQPAQQPNMYPNQQMMYNQPPMYGYMNQPQMQPQPAPVPQPTQAPQQTQAKPAQNTQPQMNAQPKDPKKEQEAKQPAPAKEQPKAQTPPPAQNQQPQPTQAPKQTPPQQPNQPMYGGQPQGFAGMNHGYAQPNQMNVPPQEAPVYGYMNQQPQMQPNMYPNQQMMYNQPPMYGGQPMYGQGVAPTPGFTPAPGSAGHPVQYTSTQQLPSTLGSEPTVTSDIYRYLANSPIYDSKGNMVVPPKQNMVFKAPENHVTGGKVSAGGFDPAKGLYNASTGTWDRYPGNKFDASVPVTLAPGTFLNNFGYQIRVNYPGSVGSLYDEYCRELMYDYDPANYHVPNTILQDTMLSDKEREQADRYRSANANYSGQGNYYYPSYYYITQNTQEELNKFKENQDWLLCELHKTVWCADGNKPEDFDREACLDKHDPVRIYQKQQEEAKKAYDADIMRIYGDEGGTLEQAYANANAYHDMVMTIQQLPYYEEKQRMEEEARQCYHAMIKESHDRVLGIKPGEHLTAMEYLNRAGRLLNEIYNEEMRQQRSRVIQYDRREFAKNLAIHTGQTVRYRPNPEVTQGVILNPREFYMAQTGNRPYRMSDDDPRRKDPNNYAYNDMDGRQIVEDVFAKNPNGTAEEWAKAILTPFEEAFDLHIGLDGKLKKMPPDYKSREAREEEERYRKFHESVEEQKIRSDMFRTIRNSKKISEGKL